MSKDHLSVNMVFQVQELYDCDESRTFYRTEIWDGPDGLDHEVFECTNLGEVFEKLTLLRFITLSQYAIDSDDLGEPLVHASRQFMQGLK